MVRLKLLSGGWSVGIVCLSLLIRCCDANPGFNNKVGVEQGQPSTIQRPGQLVQFSPDKVKEQVFGDIASKGKCNKHNYLIDCKYSILFSIVFSLFSLKHIGNNHLSADP